MDVVFLAYSYNPIGEELARSVETLLSNQDVRVVTGEVAEGQPLTQKVKSLIEGSDSLVALFTPHTQINGGPYGWLASQWVQSELDFASLKQMPSIAFVEKNVAPPGGLLQGNERIDYDPGQPLPAFLKLASVVGAWKLNQGRRVRVRVLPAELEKELGQPAPQKCEYRLTRETDGAQLYDWRPARLSIQPGGAFAFLENVQKDALIELKIAVNNKTWGSRATPQWYHVQLESKGP